MTKFSLNDYFGDTETEYDVFIVTCSDIFNTYQIKKLRSVLSRYSLKSLERDECLLNAENPEHFPHVAFSNVYKLKAVISKLPRAGYDQIKTDICFSLGLDHHEVHVSEDGKASDEPTHNDVDNGRTQYLPKIESLDEFRSKYQRTSEENVDEGEELFGTGLLDAFSKYASTVPQKGKTYTSDNTFDHEFKFATNEEVLTEAGLNATKGYYLCEQGPEGIKVIKKLIFLPEDVEYYATSEELGAANEVPSVDMEPEYLLSVLGASKSEEIASVLEAANISIASTELACGDACEPDITEIEPNLWLACIDDHDVTCTMIYDIRETLDCDEISLTLITEREHPMLGLMVRFS